MFMSRNFEKEFQKRIASEFGVSVVISSYEVKENRHAAKGCNLLAEGQKNLHTKMYCFAARKKFEWGRLVLHVA